MAAVAAPTVPETCVAAPRFCPELIPDITRSGGLPRSAVAIPMATAAQVAGSAPVTPSGSATENSSAPSVDFCLITSSDWILMAALLPLCWVSDAARYTSWPDNTRASFIAWIPMESQPSSLVSTILRAKAGRAGSRAAADINRREVLGFIEWLHWQITGKFTGFFRLCQRTNRAACPVAARPAIPHQFGFPGAGYLLLPRSDIGALDALYGGGAKFPHIQHPHR